MLLHWAEAMDLFNLEHAVSAETNSPELWRPLCGWKQALPSAAQKKEEAKTDYWDLVPGLQVPNFVSADTCMEVIKQVYKPQKMSPCVFPLIMKWVIKKYMYNFPLVEMEAHVLWPEA